MAGRKVVQDSDDEEDSDHGPPSTSKVQPLQSNKALTREILNAQNSLFDLTPSGRNSDSIFTQPITTTLLPNMSKLKRRQTTGGTPDSNKKRLLETYGATKSKDDFDFRDSSDEGGDIVSRKRLKHEDGIAGQDSSGVRYGNESYTLDSSPSNNPLHERQDPVQDSITTAATDDDTIVTAPSRAKKGRAMSLNVIRDTHEISLTTHATDYRLRETGPEYFTGSNETPSGDSSIKKKRSRRRLPTHCSSSEAQQDASISRSEMISGGISSSNVLETAVSEIGGLSRASPDVLSLAPYEPYVHCNSTSTSTEMLPPLVKHALALQPSSDSSYPSTVPNTTPAEPSQVQATATNERSYLNMLSTGSSPRMTSPTIASNSTQAIDDASEHSISANIEGQFKPSEGSVNMQVAEENMAIDSALRPSPPAKERSRPPALATTDPRIMQEPALEFQDELSKPSATHEESGSSLHNPLPLKGKLKRKAQDTIHTDELGSDDVAGGLLEEQYQPRPSRSRANRADEHFLLAVDFSKRPEAVAKARIKRRRTTGGHIPTHEDVTVESISAFGDDEPKALRKTKNKRTKATDDHKPLNGAADIVDPHQHDTDGIEKNGEAEVTSLAKEKRELEEIADVIDDNKGNDLDEATKPLEKTEEPKKKRGRPRKKTTEEPHLLPHPSNDNPPASPAANTEKPTKPPPVKKPAKRRKTNDTTMHISDERVMSDNEDDFYLQSQPETPMKGKIDTAAIDTQNSNPVPPESPPRHSNPLPPIQTPQKSAPRGPDKHSPLNSGKVPYRVGLSKKARIEPLLRIVRK